jgi:hypothetical protein
VTRRLVCAVRDACLALYAAGIIGAALATAGVRPFNAPAPHDPLATSPATALGLLAHNAPIALWPLALVALGWPALTGARAVGDALIAGQLVGHGLIVGNALGQHPAAWRYLPHLPLEWLAIAAPAGACLAARQQPHARARRALTARELVAVAMIVFAALVLAALIETYLVPLP